MRSALFPAALVLGLATPAAPETAPVGVLFADPSGADSTALRVLLIREGPAAVDAEYVLSLASPDGAIRTLSAAVPASGWTADGLQLLAFEPFPLPREIPEVVVAGNLAGDPPQTLGTLTRAAHGGRQLRRALPFAAEGPGRVLALASVERLGPSRFTIKVAYVNCGQRLDRDYDAFLHFEPEPTGGNLSETSEMGLYPSGKPTDSSAWREAEITVVCFGPYELPTALDRPLYVRVGLYDRQGDGSRVPLAGAAEDNRVLVGRFVNHGEGPVFERAPLGEAAP